MVAKAVSMSQYGAGQAPACTPARPVVALSGRA